MPQTQSLPGLFEPSLPGEWLVNFGHIWQMKLLDANNFGRFCSDRGLSRFSESDITQLWQLGLLKADLIVSHRKFNRIGIVDRGIDRNGHHVYSDERPLHHRTKGWGKTLRRLKPLRDDIQLLFHPFRYYIIWHFNKTLEINISRMQMFHQEGYHRLLDLWLSMYNRVSCTKEFTQRINFLNEVVSLAVITEPCTYERVFHSINFSLMEVDNIDTGANQMSQQIAEFWQNNVFSIYHRISIERLEEIRQELCVATQMLDSNRWIHTLLCLGKGKLRIELEDCLGGALLLRTMAEMIRRATEQAFDVLLREEDELGFGWVPENVKAKIYGTNRLLDGNENAAREFMRQHELHYGLRLRFYVEGATEWAALRHFFHTIGANYIEVINLRGEVAQKGGRGVTFRENLRSDINMHIFSMVLIDGDRDDFVSAVKKAARDDEICGCFYISKQDFEFANFSLWELEEVLWQIVLEDEDAENKPTEEDRARLHEAIKYSRNAEELKNQAKRTLTQLAHISKGEIWGKKLMEFAWKNPTLRGEQRQIQKVIQVALTTKTASYEFTRRENRVDENTGELIKRSVKSN